MLRIAAQTAALAVLDVNQQRAAIRAIERADGMADFGRQVEIIAMARFDTAVAATPTIPATSGDCCSAYSTVSQDPTPGAILTRLHDVPPVPSSRSVCACRCL